MHIPFLLSPQYTKLKIIHIHLHITICTLQFSMAQLVSTHKLNVTWLLLTMETQIEEVQSTRSLSIPRISSGGRDSSEIIENNLKYTSLKDIICNTPTKSIILYEGNDFDSTIAIRNELVKRAASVYLQSAALLATRNQNYFVSFWRRLKNRAAYYSRWSVSNGNPFMACLEPICHFFNHMVGSIRPLP